MIDAEIAIDDIIIRLVDTAGIREDPDEIEAEGIRRVERLLKDATAALWIIDTSRLPDSEDMQAGESIKQARDFRDTILVLNKNDIVTDPQLPEQIKETIFTHFHTTLPCATVSALTGNGMKQLSMLIASTIKGGESEPPAVAPNFRQMDAMKRATAKLEQGLSALESGISPEFASIDIRSGYDILGGIKGEDITQDILDHIFTRFCLGK
jgi:tRNA modification GTPase